MNVHVKRVYDPSHAGDGKRILVDRLWPRGLSKEKAELDLWLKEISPSTELRKWFGHEPSRWAEFQKRYKQELGEKAELVDELRQQASEEKITLLYGARDTEHNEALVLKSILES